MVPNTSGFIAVSASESIKQSLHLLVLSPRVPEILLWNREWNAGVWTFPVKPTNWLDLGDQDADPAEV
jgi:hypothetical protein